jgi:hypothetical protein
MRNIIIFLITVSSIYLCSSIVHADEKYDFRKVRWGMTIDEVKASETNKMEDENVTVIVYRCEVAGTDSSLEYYFTKGKLVKAGYIFQEEYRNLNNYISDFEKIKKILIRKYGLPTIYDEQWLDDLYKDKPQEWGFAVSIGHLFYSSFWETEATKIKLLLHGENYKVSHAVVYESKKLIHLLEEEKQKKEQEGF